MNWVKPERQQPIASLVAGEAVIELTDIRLVLAHLSTHRVLRLRCHSLAARQGMFALIYTTEPSDTV